MNGLRTLTTSVAAAGMLFAASAAPVQFVRGLSDSADRIGLNAPVDPGFESDSESFNVLMRFQKRFGARLRRRDRQLLGQDEEQGVYDSQDIG